MDTPTNCNLSHFRMPDDHILYYCFGSRKHKNSNIVCVDCAFRLAKIKLPEENEHHPNNFQRFLGFVKGEISEVDDFKLPFDTNDLEMNLPTLSDKPATLPPLPKPPVISLPKLSTHHTSPNKSI